MRPLALSLRNFGPYAGPAAKIDFTKLDRFFLIAGDTGSGKTSLFDAISYAIYGEALGTRNGQNLRSQFASETESCVVTFSFATLTEEYEVTRSPYWIEKKERGEGFKKATEILAVSRRPLGGGEWRKLTKDTNSEGLDAVLERAIGFSHDEFSKLVVLPQGQFQQFLEMDSSKREALLKQLFPVEDHERLAALAADRAKALEQAGRDLGARQAEVRKTFDPDTADARIADLTRREIEESERVAKAETEFERIGRLFAEGRMLSGQFENLDRQKERLEALLSEAETRKAQRQRLDAHSRALTVKSPMDQAANARDDRERAVAALVTLAGQVDEARVRDEKAREGADGIEEARAQLQREREELRDLEARKVKLMELVAIDTEIAGLRKAFDDAQKELNAAIKDREGLFGLQSELDECEAGARILRTEREDLQAQYAALVILEKDAIRSIAFRDSELPAARTVRDEAGKAVEGARTELSEAEEAFRKAEAHRDRDRAAALAEKLRPGEPCPVCGSLDHPVLAAFGEDVGPDLLETCKKLVDTAQRRLQDRLELQGVASNDLVKKTETARSLSEALAGAGFGSPENLLERLARSRGREKAILEELSPLEKTLSTRTRVAQGLRDAAGSVEAAQLKLATAAQALDQNKGGRDQVFLAAGSPLDPLSARSELELEIVKALAAAASKEVIIRSIEKEAGDARELLASRTSAVRQKQDDLLELVKSVEAREGVLAAALVSAGFRDVATVSQALLPDETVADLGDTLKEYESEVDSTKGAIDSLTLSLAGRERPDLAALETREAEARIVRDTARTGLGRVQAEMQGAVTSSQRWAELCSEEKALRERGAIFLELSNDLNGLGGEGRMKLGFASFVLGRWLRHVLEEGSHRLNTLSGGRYRFLHNEGGTDGRKRLGLEIDVHDAYAGGVRGVGTLSGGEKFLASLSLALGLSDVIQALAGGRRLDALFIDEGFGSLDADSLDRAISVLDEIGEGRQVGIISHVESLKKSIASQVRVEKGPAGSRLLP
jgi:exonuclease SbcC